MGRPLTVTPDSFYDGGRHTDPVAAGLRLLEEGADWIDVGGESTRPGAPPVSAEEEAARVLPVIRGLRGAGTISIDTSKPAVAAAALAAGASVLNDVTGLSDPELAAISADFDATVVMHTRGTPATMGRLTDYADVVAEVRDALVAAALRARSPQVYLDPGIGFAKTAAQSLLVLRHVDVLAATGYPVLVGASRKSFIGATLGLPDPADRLPGSLAAVAAAYHGGAGAFRVHDVLATRQLLDLLHAIQMAG